MLTFVLLFLGCAPKSVFEQCVENRDAMCECVSGTQTYQDAGCDFDSAEGAFCGIYDMGYCDTESSQFDSEMCERVHDELDAVEESGTFQYDDEALAAACE